MLDTDTCSLAVRGVETISEKLYAHRGNWCISAIVYQELATGLLSARGTRLESGYERFLRTVEVLEFGASDALTAADFMVANKRVGHNIGLSDNQIAGHAANAGLTLVTNNLKHFSPMRGLSVVSWQ
jgi:tRNA(fMet)-specific endonuclease VapC